MDANLKLAKKKRVAHTGSKLPSISCEDPKLPPDDFVYNIMKDMDKKKNVISYQQFQEFQSQKRQDTSTNEDIISYHKPIKKVLQKKIFPLMKKCQTSLKHLEKNRCIPKPRAHVGSVPKPQFKPAPRPQFKPILNVEKNITKFQNGSSSSINKSKKSQSNSMSTISQPEFKVRKTSNFKSYVSKETVNHVKNKAEEEKQPSSSDDDAFEHFVQKANERDSSDSDTDSLLIIHRKRSKTKSKMKKKTKDSFSNKEVNRNVPKVTSRPLSDSSENEEQETFKGIKHKRNSFKRRKYSEHESPMRHQENGKEANISLSEEDSRCLSDMNRDSSDSESNLEIPTSSLLSINQSNPFGHSPLKSSGNIKENMVAHSTINVDIINFDSNSCYPEPTKCMLECIVPCYVRLVRDPELDKKAMNFCLTSPISPTSDMFYSSDDDCIIIDENSDNEEIPEVPKSLAESSSTSWPCEDTDQGYSDAACEIPKQDLDSQVKESHTTRDFSISKLPLSNTQANTTVLVHNLDGINSLSDSNHPISIELATSVKESLNQLSLKTETDMDECVIVGEKSRPDTPEKILESDSYISEKIVNPDLFSQAKEEIPSTEHNEVNTINSEMGDFNVKIVAVQSLSELVEPSAPESNDVEVIDLSDDDSQIIDVKEKCEPDPKILDILSKIDFESLKEVMSKIKVEKSTNEFCQVGKSSTCSDLLPTCTSIPMPTCEVNEINKEINSTKRIGFQKQNSKYDINNDELRDCLELTPAKTDSQAISLNASVKDCHTSNQTLRNDTDEGIQIVDNEITDSLFNVCATEILAEVSSENLVKETNPLQTIHCINPSSLENRTVTNVAGMLPIHSKQNSDDVSHQFCETVQNYSEAVCKSLKVIELPTKEEAKNYQDSSSVFRTTRSNAEISNKGKADVPELADKQCKISKVRNETSIPFHHIMQPVKREIVIESPSDELDIIAASLINDLQPPNKKVRSLMSVYKEEYKKYKDIKNAETNVSAGLKLLHDKQVNKLAHLQASIKNLVKHDACFYKINQEDNYNNSKISMKNEIADKKNVKKENPENSKELRREGPLPPEKDVKVAVKFESAGPSREKVYTTMMMNYKCALCGKPATARCQGCGNIFYCSSYCGEQSWRQGHFAVCKKS